MQTLADMIRDFEEDRALRLAVATPNLDPADIIVARESAAALLEDYIAHVALNRAARRIIANIGGRVS